MGKNKIYQLGLYEKAMPSDLTWEEKFTAAKKAGFDFVEISIDETDAKLARLDYTEADFEELKAAMKKTSMSIQSMCLSGHRRFPLGSHDISTQHTSLEIMEKAILFARKLGIRNIQLAGYDVYYENHDQYTRDMFDYNLGKCVQMASQYGVILGFETMETDFMNTAFKAMFYINKYDSPYLKLYPDIGNLTNASRVTNIPVNDDLQQAKGHIIAAHLKEVIEGHYREIPFGTGDTDYDGAIACLKKQGVYMFTAEFWYVGGKHWEKDLECANNYIREKIEKHY